MSDVTTPAPPTKKKRRWWLRGPVGCLFFSLGFLVAFVAALPTILSRVGIGQLDALGSWEPEGRLVVRKADLSWFSRQELQLDLDDPRGGDVLEVRAELPEIAHFFGGLGDLGRTRVSFELTLVAEADGSTNLQDAVRSKRDRQVGDEPRRERRDDPSSEPGWHALFDRAVEFEVADSRLLFENRRPEAKVRSARVEEIRARLQVAPGERALVTFEALVVEPSPGRVRGELRLPDPVAGDGSARPELELEAEDVPVELMDALFGAEGWLVDWLGTELDATASGDLASLDAPTESGSLTLTLTGPRAQVQQTLTVTGERLELAPEGVVRFTPAARAATRLAGSDPEAPVAVSFAGDPELTVDVTRLVLTLPEGTLAGSTQPGAGDLLDGLELELVATTPSLAVTAKALAKEGEQPPTQTLGGGRLEVRATPSDGLSTSFRAPLAFGAGAPGGLDASVTASRDTLFELLTRAEREDTDTTDQPALDVPPATLRLAVERVPSAFLDEVLASKGLSAGVLGPELTARVQADGLDADDAIVLLELDSALAEARLRGAFFDGRFALVPESTDVPGDESHVGFSLTPLSNQALVGQLVPVLASVESADPEHRAMLRFEEAALPLDGDLSRLDATVVLDLGRVRARLLPALATDLFPGRTLEQVEELDPLRLEIRGGRIAYDELPLSIDGRELPLEGSFDLASRALSLRTSIRLDQIGGDVGRFLAEAKDVLPAELRVPLEVAGTPRSPRLKISDAFTQQLPQLLLDAAQQKLGQDLQDKVDDEIGEALKKLFGRDG